MAMTMLQMAGAAPTPATTADGVLLIIDAQREYTDGLLPLPGVAAAVEALAVLLEKARKAGAPVVHVRHQSKGKAFNPSSTGYEIVAPLTPRAGETIVDKGLAQRLRRHRSRQASCGERPQEPDRRWFHDPHVRLGDGAGGHRPGLHEHDRRRHGGHAGSAGCHRGRHDRRDAINRITLAALSDRFAWVVAKAAQIT